MLILSRNSDDIEMLDILVVTVRATRDGVPIVVNEAPAGKDPLHVRSRSLAELEARSAEFELLDDVLKRHFGDILLNIHIKGSGSAQATVSALRHFASTKNQWQQCFVSSYLIKELRRARKLAKHLPLGLLQRKNTFNFMKYVRNLKLSAVGFHRLYTTSLAANIARRSGLFTYVYTVNRVDSARRHHDNNFDGVVSDFPEKLQRFRD